MFSVQIHRCFQLDIITTSMVTADFNINGEHRYFAYRCSSLIRIQKLKMKLILFKLEDFKKFNFETLIIIYNIYSGANNVPVALTSLRRLQNEIFPRYFYEIIFFHFYIKHSFKFKFNISKH